MRKTPFSRSKKKTRGLFEHYVKSTISVVIFAPSSTSHKLTFWLYSQDNRGQGTTFSRIVAPWSWHRRPGRGLPGASTGAYQEMSLSSTTRRRTRNEAFWIQKGILQEGLRESLSGCQGSLGEVKNWRGLFRKLRRRLEREGWFTPAPWSCSKTLFGQRHVGTTLRTRPMTRPTRAQALIEAHRTAFQPLEHRSSPPGALVEVTKSSNARPLAKSGPETGRWPAPWSGGSSE